MVSLPRALEAVLFASGEAVSKKRISQILQISPEMLDAAIDELSEKLSTTGLTLVQHGDELQLRTSPEAAPFVEAFRQSELSRDLGKAGMETLAIILYQGSATRGDIDWIRGVNSTAALRSLLMRGLIERSVDDADKRRARYSATVDALAHLGISRKEELPGYAELQGILAKVQDSQEGEV